MKLLSSNVGRNFLANWLFHILAREHKTPRTSDVRPKETIIFGVISSVFATCLILSIVFVSWRCAARKNKSLLSSATQYGDKAAEETLEFSSLNTDEITFKELVRKGKFSSLWNAEYGGRKVIFKIYKQGYHSKWRNEMKIYNMIGPHPNVLEVSALWLHFCLSFEWIIVNKGRTCSQHWDKTMKNWKSYETALREYFKRSSYRLFFCFQMN